MLLVDFGVDLGQFVALGEGTKKGTYAFFEIFEASLLYILIFASIFSKLLYHLFISIDILVKSLVFFDAGRVVQQITRRLCLLQ